MSSSRPMRKGSLIQLVRALPQELIDVIYTLTFDLLQLQSIKRQVEISSGYTPPALLHINRLLRIDYAPNYYSDTIFHGRSKKLLFNWIASLPSEHVKLLKRVRLIRRPGPSFGSKCAQEGDGCEKIREDLLELLSDDGFEIEDARFLTVWT